MSLTTAERRPPTTLPNAKSLEAGAPGPPACAPAQPRCITDATSHPEVTSSITDALCTRQCRSGRSTSSDQRHCQVQSRLALALERDHRSEAGQIDRLIRDAELADSPAGDERDVAT